MAVTAKTFTFLGFSGVLLDSRYLDGVTPPPPPPDPPDDPDDPPDVPDFPPVTGLWSDPLETVHYYVSNTGSDSNNGTSDTTAFKTIKKAMQTLVGQTGKTVQVQNGTYQTTENLLNDYFHGLNISGTSGARNRIQAQTVGGAVITDLGIPSMTYPMSGIRITESKYIDVTGFVVEFTGTATNGHLPPPVVNVGGTAGRNRVARCLVRKVGNMDDFASWFSMSGSYNLVEDCYGVGATRYGFFCGGTTSTDNRLVWRRCMGRFDYSQSNQPKATYNHYGANGGGTTNNIAYLNCLAIDQKAGNWGGGTQGFTYGGLTIIKTAANDYVAGCIVLNNESEYGGFWLDGSGSYIYDTVLWDIKWNPFHEAQDVPAGLWGRGSLDSVSDVARLTVGMTAGQPILDLSGNLVTHNNLVNPSQSYLLFPNAGPYTADGATVINRIGVSGTFHGDAGWNTVTDEPLWPWLDEGLIKTYFSKSISIPSGGANGQTSIDARRGFCTTGKQRNGVDTVTLTSYIWEYLGTQMPTSIYNSGS